MARGWRQRVVVITGASSGIGRASALRLARRGANLVLAARREEPLETLAAECERLGARCRVVPTDVSIPADMEALAREAVAAFGHFDAWVNNAGVYLVGRLEDTPEEAFRQVMETNFFGTVTGARVALAHFRRQGTGTLVNVASVFGRVAGPYSSAYVASKHAVRGLTSSLRQELQGTGIHVCTLLPAAIDTPLWHHAANYTGHALRPLEPVYPVERVARALVRLLERPRAEVMVGPAGRSFAALHGVAPALFERTMRPLTDAGELADAPHPHAPGNVFTPMREGTEASGGYHGGLKQWLRRGLLAGGALALVAARAQRRPRTLRARLQRALA
ncbi:SDR family NAD(P)-dependent oxidoreductase [Aggregicoccus sp. 17bor-14]|uniref:SDR family NAD(P)-dependent oxidoreductase n=1 Tax=Myxococcaceae TaxID=31 RepID=UPI00129D1800|nr:MULTISPECIES: SDR family oxidoreductase [Myxococcaceae]MBF5046625.1 SDR family NAD(P)-dependent oxidoreductase [Simulacricoccus sp. 17bor-14]MRI92335.1 SDR family NAD(P)-dependent oxidoreductase [Aggregicoccus sp. 17bor-14]